MIRFFVLSPGSPAPPISDRNGCRCCSFGSKAESDDQILYGVRSAALVNAPETRLLSLAMAVEVEFLEGLDFCYWFSISSICFL